MKNAKRGFTLIELLVVVLIVGILAAVALPQYTKAVERSRLAGVWSTMGSLRQALAVAYLQGDGADVPYLDIGIECGEAGSGMECAVPCPSGRWDRCAYKTYRGNGQNPQIDFEGNFTVPGGSAANISLVLNNSGRSCSGNSATCKYLGIE